MVNLIRWLCITLLLAVTGPANPAALPVLHRPRVPAESTPETAKNLGWASSNWSGYALSGSGFTAVTGDWIVQSVAPSSRATYSSQWVGIDGFNNSNLIQTGTESDYYNGAAHYDAWWEILPAAETVIPTIVVHPGDHMNASINKGRGSAWTVTIRNATTNQSFTTIQTYAGPGTSAEWIEEAPTVGGRIATLANYGLTTFDPGTVNGHAPGLVPSQGGAMVQHRATVSTPSNPDVDADGFNTKYGSIAPPPPNT